MSAECGLKHNDSVLITASVPGPSLQTSVGGGGRGGEVACCGGSGFVRHGVVLTSATWMAHILTLRPLHSSNPHSRSGSSPGSIPSGIEWELTQPKAALHILYQTTSDATCATEEPPGANRSRECPNQGQWSCSGLGGRKAAVDSVLFLRDVYCCLAGQLQAMGHWRCELQSLSTHQKAGREGGGENGREEGEKEGKEDELVSLQNLLLPLSCVVVLKTEGLDSSQTTSRSRSRSSVSGYRPCVGDKLVAISTPFATYCPEVFHNSMTSGHVCKLIGRTGKVFLTDACHLPNTEGAGLRRGTSLSADVVAMVLAPLFSEKGHLTGLSLATSLSSLPPPHLHPSAPSAPSPLPFIPTLPTLPGDKLTGVSQLVVAVAMGNSWGSGLLLSPDCVLTCAHVVKPHSSSVVIYTQFEPGSHSGSVLEWNRDMDLAIIRLKKRIVASPILEPVWDQIHQSHTRPVRERCRRPQEIHHGGSVCAVGYETPPCRASGAPVPLVTRGEVTQVAGWGGEGVMLVSSAVVLPGMSGGLLVSGEDGQILGLLVSISEDITSGHTYPTVNYSLSLLWLLPALLPYILTGDSGSLHQLFAENGERVRQLWSLGTASLPSKL